MDNAEKNLQKLLRITVELKANDTAANDLSDKAVAHRDAFVTALCNDLNSPQALACIWQMLDDDSISNGEKLNLLYDFDQALGLNLESYEAEKLDIPEAVTALLEQRKTARDNKDWAGSDRIRDEIAEMGFKVVDQGNKQKLNKV